MIMFLFGESENLMFYYCQNHKKDKLSNMIQIKLITARSAFTILNTLIINEILLVLWSHKKYKLVKTRLQKESGKHFPR